VLEKESLLDDTSGNILINKYMPQVIIRHGESEREIRYDHKEDEVPLDTLYKVVHMMPAEIERIKTAKTDEIQQILRRYI
jgi:hypothetical protein